jgi:hypothetical protein
MSLTG